MRDWFGDLREVVVRRFAPRSSVHRRRAYWGLRQIAMSSESTSGCRRGIGRAQSAVGLLRFAGRVRKCCGESRRECTPSLRAFLCDVGQACFSRCSFVHDVVVKMFGLKFTAGDAVASRIQRGAPGGGRGGVGQESEGVVQG